MAQDENAEADRGVSFATRAARAGHAAKDEVVGEFEEVHADGHDGDAQGDDRVLG